MQQLREAMRGATADPPPSRIALDEIVVREQRRRIRSRLLTVAGAAILAAGAVPVLASVDPGPPSPSPPVWTVPVAPEPSGIELSDLQGWTAKAAGVAAAALPDGYRIANPPTEYWGGAGEFALMWADIAGPAGGRSQLLIFLDLEPDLAPSDDMCAEPRPQLRFSGDETSCEPLDVAGTAVRIGMSRDELPGTGGGFEFPVVSHYRHGWALHLWELPYRHPLHDRDAEPAPMDAPVLSVRQLAELALHPGLVPGFPVPSTTR